MNFPDTAKKKYFFYSFLFCAALFAQCRQKKNNDPILPNSNADEKAISPADTQNITFKLFQVDAGWGYDIFINDKKYIHQPNIPAINGLQTFVTKEHAEITAAFVIRKLQQNVMPPTVSMEELDSLGVLGN